MRYQIAEIRGETGFTGFLKLSRYHLRHSLYAGGLSPEITRERLEGLRAVAVLPYDPDQDRVVLIEQFRIGALEQGRGAWLLEIVGGMWDPDQTAEQVAHREAQEEADCLVSELLPIGDIWISPGTSTERVRIYCGRTQAVTPGGIHGLAQEGEDIRVEVVSLRDALKALETGDISAATAVIALQWLALHREEVRRRWVRAG